jgi:enamine deaminase RidA (YjgF/YER057c/UK114 family)
LEKAVRTLYHPMCTSRNPAWLVCFNNIALLTISAQCGFCADQQSLQQRVAEECLFRSLIANTRQYLDNFQVLLKPCLVNVQALLSLVGFHIIMPL